MSKRAIVVSLGGGVVVPQEGVIDYLFLKGFKRVILKHVKKGIRFIIVVGGGKTCRLYQNAAKKVGRLASDDLDWIGIHSTRLNAHLLRTIFRGYSHLRINTEPTKIEKVKEPILVGAGWKPGWSTDYDAVQLAVSYGAKEVINLTTGTDYVYDKNPRKYRDAKKIEQLKWKEFFGIVGRKWVPGANLPFDPVASRLAAKHQLKVLVMGGRDLDNFDQYLTKGKFKGTVIS
jgi:uridylate kinase